MVSVSLPYNVRLPSALCVLPKCVQSHSMQNGSPLKERRGVHKRTVDCSSMPEWWYMLNQCNLHNVEVNRTTEVDKYVYSIKNAQESQCSYADVVVCLYNYRTTSFNFKGMERTLCNNRVIAVWSS